MASTLNKSANNPCELIHSYSVGFGNEVEMSKYEIIRMIQRAVFDPLERDTVYNLGGECRRVESCAGSPLLTKRLKLLTKASQLRQKPIIHSHPRGWRST